MRLRILVLALLFGCFCCFKVTNVGLSTEQIVWKNLLEQIVFDVHRDVIICFSMFFVCLAALFMTGSRGGVTVSLLVMIVAFVIFFRRDLPRGKKSLIVAISGATAVALILLQFLGGDVGHRFDAVGLSSAGRPAAYRSMLRMIADHPWFGTGLGTFAWIFPAYRSGNISMRGVWDIGHSTPLEFAANSEFR